MMYDPMSQRTIVNRINAERVAQARRDHLLQAARDDRDEYQVERRPARTGLRVAITSALGDASRAAGGIRHGLATRAHGLRPVDKAASSAHGLATR